MHTQCGYAPEVPPGLLMKILREVAPVELEFEAAIARLQGVPFSFYVRARIDALKCAPNSHVYLARLRNERIERRRHG